MNDAEITRLRDRTHELAGRVQELAGRLARLERNEVGVEYQIRDQARGIGELRDELREIERRVDQIDELVDAMTKADELAHAVAEELEAHRREWFKGWRRVAGATAALILLVPAIHDAVSWLYS